MRPLLAAPFQANAKKAVSISRALTMSLTAVCAKPRGRKTHPATNTAVKSAAVATMNFDGLRPFKGPHLRERTSLWRPQNAQCGKSDPESRCAGHPKCCLASRETHLLLRDQIGAQPISKFPHAQRAATALVDKFDRW